jgi:light-regulated signal transduction histidine kinase (bacteriophytochrome)/ActR/RegA family two-component response regulator
MLKPREQLSEAQLKEALDHCASEPIHIPGSIQPHGMLVVISPNGMIEQISANAKEFFGKDASVCLGKPLSDFLKKSDIDALMQNRAGEKLQPLKALTLTLTRKHFDAVSHLHGESTVIELEPVVPQAHPSDFYYDQLRNFSIGMHKLRSFHEVFDHVTDSIRAITGFDRVKLYRFDHDWHGEVVAESRASYMPSYKGLHFPSTDIPEQARRLYMQNYLRLIADTSYKPVPLLPVNNPRSKAPLDLSLSMLRSVSPVHIQYLENINIHASMSVSVIQNGKLWGLIACHHNTALYVPYQARNVCEIMGHIFSAQLSGMEDARKRESQVKREHLVRKLSTSLDTHSRIDQLMGESHGLAIDALESDGLVVKAYVHVLRYGGTPDEKVIGKLIDWLKTQSQETVFYTDDAPSYFKDHPDLQSLTGGILAVPISTKSHDYIIWFRNAIIKEVTWAGNPEKPVEESKAGYRLTPRSSFALWKEQVRHRSKPWTDEDIRTAKSVVKVLMESEKMSAQQANMAKTEFLANMSHEIRTPMNAVIGLSRLLARSDPLSDRQREYIRTLQVSADGLLSLINDLLDISKVESRTLELEAIPFNLKTILEEVISMTSVKALEKGVTFTIDDSGALHHDFIGDPSRIRQIIINLCSNAVKFTEQGSIHLLVQSEPATVAGMERICVLVRDTGIGIAAEKLETVFQKFIQAESSISRRYGGTGLGLAITKMLTEAMGGEITVTSELGKGSEFKVCFNLKAAGPVKEKTPDAAHTSQQAHADSPKVLLVEDYEANILVATTYLEGLGYRYDVARSGMEAVNMAKQNMYHAILMDVQMPELNGFDATQLVREFESVQGKTRTPIIGMTAHALAGDRERCIAAGMDDYIPKPVSEAELKGKLERHIAAVRAL